MNVKELISKEIEKIPESYLFELLDFVKFLELKELKASGKESMFLSESSLKKDWLKLEEEEAWKDL